MADRLPTVECGSNCSLLPRAEERSSGIAPPKPTELETLVEEIVALVAIVAADVEINEDDEYERKGWKGKKRLLTPVMATAYTALLKVPTVTLLGNHSQPTYRQRHKIEGTFYSLVLEITPTALVCNIFS